MLRLDATFSALSDPTRRAILRRLAAGDATVGELAEPFSISMPAISRHLRVLENASLIKRSRQGQHRRCSLQPEGIAAARRWLEDQERFWSVSLDRLAEHIKLKAKKS